MVKCIIGPPVSGEDLFGRELELKKIWNTIDTGSALLISPRRFGKTSIAIDMKNCPKPGYCVYYLDVESLDRPESFIVEILNKTRNLENIQTKFKGVFTSSIKRLDELHIGELKIKLREVINTDWVNKGNDVFEKLSSENECECIFILDELPTMLVNMMKNPEGIKITKMFLNWLRGIRNNYSVKFIICGSISIDQVVADCNAVSSINDLERILIDPLTKDLSEMMIEGLFKEFEIKITRDIVETIYERVGGVPFFIKLLTKYIVEEIQENKIDLSYKTVDDVYYKKVLGNHGREYFKHYFTRLDDYESKFGITPKLILDILASRHIISTDELKQRFFAMTKSDDHQKFINLIERLEDDFYIVIHSSKKCMFHTRVLEDLWKKSRGL